jgi:hypothetical protein
LAGLLLGGVLVSVAGSWPWSGKTASGKAARAGKRREPSVYLTADLSNMGWQVTFHMSEPVDVVEYQRVGEPTYTPITWRTERLFQGEYEQLAFVTLPDLYGRVALRVRYRPHQDPSVLRGPFDVVLDTDEQAVRSVKEQMGASGDWVTFRHYAGRLRCQFGILGQKHALRAIRYGIDRELPDRALRFRPGRDGRIGDDEISVFLPDDARWVVVELEFLDGTTERRTYPVAQDRW